MPSSHQAKPARIQRWGLLVPSPRGTGHPLSSVVSLITWCPASSPTQGRVPGAWRQIAGPVGPGRSTGDHEHEGSVRAQETRVSLPESHAELDTPHSVGHRPPCDPADTTCARRAVSERLRSASTPSPEALQPQVTPDS